MRTTDGAIEVYPVVETIHKNHICHEVLAPAPVAPEIAQKAHDLAQKVLTLFDGAGVFAIEMFLVGDEVLVNEEIAPRVRNSNVRSRHARHRSSRITFGPFRECLSVPQR